jgi:hypothetical protein
MAATTTGATLLSPGVHASCERVLYIPSSWSTCAGSAVCRRIATVTSDRTDDMWHHLMVTWEQESGLTKMYFDGRAQSAFWV